MVIIKMEICTQDICTDYNELQSKKVIIFITGYCEI